MKIDDDTNEEQNPGGQDNTSSTSTCIWVTLNSHPHPSLSFSNMEKHIIINEKMLLYLLMKMKLLCTIQYILQLMLIYLVY